MQMEQGKNDDKGASKQDNQESKTGWSGLQINLMNKKRKVTEHMKDWIILNNRLTMSLFEIQI